MTGELPLSLGDDFRCPIAQSRPAQADLHGVGHVFGDAFRVLDGNRELSKPMGSKLHVLLIEPCNH